MVSMLLAHYAADPCFPGTPSAQAYAGVQRFIHGGLTLHPYAPTHLLSNISADDGAACISTAQDLFNGSCVTKCPAGTIRNLTTGMCGESQETPAGVRNGIAKRNVQCD